MYQWVSQRIDENIAKMKTLLLPICVLVVAVVVVYSARFDTSNEERKLVQQWLRNLQKHRPTRLSKYEYKNCGDPHKEIAYVKSLMFGPDPIALPGPLQVSFGVGIERTIHSPLRATVDLRIMVGNVWVKIPCTGEIGSCSYDDICQYLSQIPECPPQFVSAGIPCKCPFARNEYRLLETEFDVPIAIFPPGYYHAILNLTTNNNVDFVSCAELYVTFA